MIHLWSVAVSQGATKKYAILVCKGPECGEKRHSADIHAAFARELKTCPLSGNEATLEQYSCFGKCKSGPNVLVREMKTGETRLFLLMPTAGAGAHLYHGVQPKDVRRILEEHVAKGCAPPNSRR